MKAGLMKVVKLSMINDWIELGLLITNIDFLI
jgi:hypothetical protein